jgi:hypothetical protein
MDGRRRSDLTHLHLLVQSIARCKRARGWQTRSPPIGYRLGMAAYRIIQIGSLRDGWAIEVDGIITRSAPTAAPLAAWLDARLAGANEFDADGIAKAIAARPPPSYEERMAVFFPSGRPEPSRDPFTPRPSHKSG